MAPKQCGKLAVFSNPFAIVFQLSFDGAGIYLFFKTSHILQQTIRIILLAVEIPIQKVKWISVKVQPLARYLKNSIKKYLYT